MIKDATGFALTPQPFKRVVSLVPSQSEYLVDLGIMPIGRTKFCDHPKLKNVPIVGGTKDFSLKKIQDLKPDLILANKEENVPAPLLEIRKSIPVWTTDVYDLQSALNMMREVAILVDKGKPAQLLIHEIKAAFESLCDDLRQTTKRKRVLYLIWKNPWMSVGKDTFIHAMLGHCGFENAMHNHTRYPEIANEEIANLKPELILLSSEPFPFKNKHIPELKHLCPNAKVFCVDGAIFSWYGSRLRQAPNYFKSLMIY